ncbi:MAG: hypothetical protein EBS19_05615 [Spirochaetia bacterium]|nr:hypothetical protein [Spirochaetia bacterium]
MSLNEMKLTAMLAEKFNSMDSESIEKEWKEIEKEGDEVSPEKVENVLKRTPGFSATDLINFGEYCRKGFTDYEWEELTIDEHLSNWLTKIK